MREHRLIFEDVPAEGLPASLSAKIRKMGTPEWKDEVKTEVRQELSELKEKVQLDEAKKLTIETFEKLPDAEKVKAEAEKRVMVEVIDTRLKVMEAMSGASEGPSGIPGPIREQLQLGLTKAVAGATGLEGVSKILKITPEDGAKEILRLADIAWNKIIARMYGAIGKIPYIGDSFKDQAESARESIAMLEMQGGFFMLVREMRTKKREISITWKQELWPKWKEAQQKSGKTPKEFAKDTAKKYVEANPALTGEIAMSDIPLPSVTPAPGTPEAAKPAVSDAAKPADAKNESTVTPESLAALKKDHDIDSLWGETHRVVPASGVRMKLVPVDKEYCRIQNGKIFFEGKSNDKTFSIVDMPENTQVLFRAKAGDGLESTLMLRLNDAASASITLREIKTMKDKVSLSLGDRVISIVPAKRGFFS
ncbi:MAG TPA: hypothetical protein VJB82_00845 [Candidatus Peribacterales bacterium]|nr:hypothetical protein [Candidatus Peribacterales bacterium]